MSTIEKVAEFHKAFSIKDPEVQTIPFNLDWQGELTNLEFFADLSASLAKATGERAKEYNSKLLMRLHLICEELSELAEAMSNGDLVECLDALTDIQYVLDGTYLTLGLAAVKQAAFDEVHSSNMSKLGADGKPVLDGGRVVKGPNYVKPELAKFITDIK